MVIIAVEAVPAGCKPPAAVRVRISTGERQGFGAAAPLSTKTSSLRGRAGDSSFMPKLVEHIWSRSIGSQRRYPQYACSIYSSGAFRALASFLV